MIYMYSIHIRNADIVLICVYIYVCVFVVVHNCFLTVLFYIVKLNIIFVYYQFYLLYTNTNYYYYYLNMLGTIIRFKVIYISNKHFSFIIAIY